jgi:hypothetical protein
MRDEATGLTWADDEEVTLLLQRIDADVLKWTAAVSDVLSALDQESRRMPAQPASPPNAVTETVPGSDLASSQDIERAKLDTFAVSDPKGQVGTPAPSDPAAEATGSGSAADDDQALFMSLDPEAQRWIRVKQRISGQRSVRELLAEYRAATSKKRD